MNDLESLLLEELTDGVEPKLLIRTRTRIDVGRWWRSNPIWLCIIGEELIVMAVARRRYAERVAIADCQASFYSHATGELVIKHAEKLRFRSFSMTPREALSVLDLLKIHH